MKIAISTLVVASLTLLSRILGFIRDLLLAAVFGAGRLTDAFIIAFRIPNLIRRFVFEGAVSVTLVPHYSNILKTNGKKDAQIFISRVLTYLVSITIIIIFFGEIAAVPFIKIFAPGFSPELILLTSDLFRIMLPYILVLIFVAVSMTILNSHDSFFAPSAAPAALNIGIIVGILLGPSFFKEPVYGAAWGVIGGGVLQIILQIPFLIKKGHRLSIDFNINDETVKKALKEIIPNFAGSGIYQINILMGSIFATFLSQGSVTFLYYSDRLNELVLGVFVISLSSVLLPAFALKGDENRDKGSEVFMKSLKAVLLVSLPAVAALIVLGIPIVFTLFYRGAFDIADGFGVYKALIFSSPGIIAASLMRVTVSALYGLDLGHYARKGAFLSIAIFIPSALILMNTSLQHGGIAFTGTISVTFQSMYLLFIIKREYLTIGFGRLIKPLAKIIISSMVMSVVLVIGGAGFDWFTSSLFNKIKMLSFLILSGGFSYWLMMYLFSFRIKETL